VDYDLEWVLIGHSERRHVFKETLEDVTEKVKMARKYDLGIILCVGENLEQREKEQTF